MRRDVGRIFVQLFDVTLEAYFGRHLLCIHAPTCGYGPALEHNGDLYTCDHFVEPGQKLGNIATMPLIDLVASPQMRKFGDDKRDTLTKQCRQCEVRFLCNGGCPKDRFALSRDGEPGQIGPVADWRDKAVALRRRSWTQPIRQSPERSRRRLG